MIKRVCVFCCRKLQNRTFKTRVDDEDLSQIEHLASLHTRTKERLRRHSAIICTLGPSSNDVETLVKMMASGMNIARLNMAHGSHDHHLETIKNIRKANYIYAKEAMRSTLIGIGVDLQGAAIRTGVIKTGKEVHLKTGAELTITINEKYSEDVTESLVYVHYMGRQRLMQILRPGMLIYIDDGLIQLKVLKIDHENIRCRIENGGQLGSRKGVNFPGVEIDMPTLFEKDRADIKFALENKVDMLFASFIRDRAGIEEIRSLIDEGDKALQMAIIAKIENQQGLERLDEILAATDGVMVARGDLGIELPVEKVFLAQKSIIAKCNLVGKPVMCSTHMLDSMLHKPRPTRAETSDIANAVLDGTDGVMLSAETAVGKYPVECVTVMAKVCREAEAAVPYVQMFIDRSKMIHPPTEVALSVAFAAVAAAQKVLAVAILTTTETGKTAALLASLRPACPIIAITENGIVARKCHLYRGVVPVLHARTGLAWPVSCTEGESWCDAVEIDRCWEGIPTSLLPQLQMFGSILRVASCTGMAVAIRLRSNVFSRRAEGLDERDR